MMHEILADGVEVFLGDCREIIPSLKRHDALISDPPYGINFVHGAGGDGIGGGKYASKFNGVAIHGDDAPFDPEPLQKGVARLLSHYWNGMMRDSEKGVPRVHPTQKPVAVMEWVIQETTEPGQSILDPYCGSASTGVAAVKLGRKFTGIEIDPGYFDIACRRIEAALREPDLFITPPKPAQQLSILDGAA